MCPGHRAVARAPPEPLVASVSLRRSVLPSPQHGGFGLWSCRFRGHLCVHFRYGPTTRSPSRRWLCRSTSCASFPLHLRSKLRGLTFVPMGLPPTEHICLVWTYRAVPTTPPECPAASVSPRQAILPSPTTRRFGPRSCFVSRPPGGSLTLRPGDSLIIPRMTLSVGVIRFVSSADATQATRVLTVPLGGLTPPEHASHRWTH